MMFPGSAWRHANIFVLAYVSLVASSIVWVLLAYIGIDFSLALVTMLIVAFSALSIIGSAVAGNDFKLRLSRYRSTQHLMVLVGLCLLTALLPLPGVYERTGGDPIRSSAVLVVSSSFGFSALFFLFTLHISNPLVIRRRLIQFFKLLFLINTIVSLAQLQGFSTQALDKQDFTENETLAMIILPSYEVGLERLRIPGLFWNGGTNAIFYSIALLYTASGMIARGRLALIPLAITAVSAFMIYHALTRRVWLALVVALSAIVAAAVFNRLRFSFAWLSIAFSIFCFATPVAMYLIVSSNVSTLQVFNPLSLFARLDSWDSYMTYFLHDATGWETFFGTGVAQAVFHLYTEEYRFIDMMWLSLLVYGGIFSLIVYGLLYAILLFRITRAATTRSTSGQESLFLLGYATLCIVLSFFQNFWGGLHTALTFFVVYCVLMTASEVSLRANSNPGSPQ